MKSRFFDKIILKNKLFSLGRVCFAISALYQQTDAGFGTETQIKERALILPGENSLKHLQSMLSEFKSEYNGYNGKSLTTTIDQELTTRNLCKSIYQIFISLDKNKKESFLSYFKLFYYDDFLKNDKHNNVSESDKKAFEELISILDGKIKELSSKPATSKPSSKPVIPWLNVYEKPAQLTPGELMAGGNQTPVKLVKRTAINTYTKNEESCFQFIDENDNPLKYKKKESSCYKINDINDHLNLTKEVYKDAIEQIHKKAYRSIKTIINNNKINEKSIESILTNYLDISNNREEIDVTGASLSQEEQQDIKKYMELCTAVYSDIYTRNFLIEEAPESVVNKWNDIIKKHEEINSLFNTLEGLMKHYREWIGQSHTDLETVTSLFGGAEKPIAPPVTSQMAKEDYSVRYEAFIESFNNYLSEVKGMERIEDKSIHNIGIVRDKLLKIKEETDKEYNWYFSDIEENSPVMIVYNRLFGHYPIPKYNKKYQLTSKAVIAASFLSKAGLNPDNVSILDIGFRNKESYGTWMNVAATSFMFLFKRNPVSAFEFGEVDYIAYIEKDINREKDRIVLVYAGSNSHIDWGIDFTIGKLPILGLSVHEGIGWMFEQSENTYQRLLTEKIINYYNTIDQKPQTIEVAITGHSLGGGLAELEAYYFKKNIMPKIQKNTGINNIDLKLFTYAAPAIIEKESTKAFENLLGKENIYRIWVTDDPVATVSEKFGAYHVGKSIPLYNLGNVETNWADIWGPHGATRYKSLIESILNPDLYQQYTNLISILDNYIRTTHLDIYKKNSRELESLIKQLKKKIKTNAPILLYLHQGLAEHIIKYSPETRHLKPYASVEEILKNAHSPRYAAALSPRFEVEVGQGCDIYLMSNKDEADVKHTPAIIKSGNGTYNLMVNLHGKLKEVGIENLEIDAATWDELWETNKLKGKVFLNYENQIIRELILKGYYTPEPYVKTTYYMMVPTTNLYKIDAIFKTHGHEIDFPIVAGTSCNPSDITAYVKDNIDIAISLELAQEWSCGSCLAKRVFVSQYSKEAPSSAYYGTGWATLLQSPHQDTLTKMFAKCVEENACTPAYLKDTSQGKNMLEQALAILEKVGLGESFKKKKVYFSRFVKQDTLVNEVRPGIELLEPYLEDKLDKITLKNLMDTPPDQYKKTIEFNLDELTNQDNIYRKILYSTTIEDHWIKLMVLLNQKDIEKLLAQYIILNENPEEKINNFAANLVAALKTFYAKSYDANWPHARPYPINENNLGSDLARLKRNVLANASWKIKEETPSSQQMTHGEGGNQQLSLERK